MASTPSSVNVLQFFKQSLVTLGTDGSTYCVKMEDVRRKQPERSRVWMYFPQSEEAKVENAFSPRSVQLWREKEIVGGGGRGVVGVVFNFLLGGDEDVEVEVEEVETEEVEEVETEEVERAKDFSR
jgi:hypothetical protein